MEALRNSRKPLQKLTEEMNTQLHILNGLTQQKFTLKLTKKQRQLKILINQKAEAIKDIN